MKMNKFLALLPVVAFAAGCNGVAPGGPSAVGSNDANEMVSGGASTTSNRPCANLRAINLRIDASDDSMLWVEATYQFSNSISTPAPVPCAPPSWSSDHDGLTVDKANRFRAGFSRRETGRATVTASAPNGVHNAIDLTLTPTNSLRGPGVCDNVTGVTMTLVSSNSNARIAVIAAYEYGGPLSTPCGVAPVWFADRRGLVVNQKNPFVASIDVDNAVQTAVTATAPSGVVGNILF